MTQPFTSPHPRWARHVEVLLRPSAALTRAVEKKHNALRSDAAHPAHLRGSGARHSKGTLAGDTLGGKLPVICWAMSRDPIEKRPNPSSSARNTVFYANYAWVLGEFAPKSDLTMHIFPLIRLFWARGAAGQGTDQSLDHSRAGVSGWLAAGGMSGGLRDERLGVVIPVAKDGGTRTGLASVAALRISCFCVQWGF